VQPKLGDGPPPVPTPAKTTTDDAVDAEFEVKE